MRDRCLGRYSFVALAVLACGTLAGSAAVGSDPEDAESRTFFEQQVRPVLVESCVGCHGPDEQKGGLRLDSLEAMLEGGLSGPAIVPGNVAESLLVESIHPDGFYAMPPTGYLDTQKVEVLTRWVEAGAHWPGASATGVAPKTISEAAKITDEDRAFWSFQPVAEVGLPDAGVSDWSRNPVDGFVLRRLSEEGLSPAPEADRATLIRRLTFDLTGLPPTPDEVAAFVADPDPNAYANLVDRLLDSPRYGERWGRHWLDLVRYADSDGHRQDAFRPHAWRYRDYVIDSFNRDKPYDQFVREQIAGDEISPDDPEMRIATMYYRHGPYEYNQRDALQQWADILNDITDVTGEVFLGMSVGCARCHDHKFDPILQADYYRLQAFFTPISWRDDLPLATQQESADYHVRRAAWDLMTAEVRSTIADIEQPYRESARARAVDLFPTETQAILNTPRAELSPFEQQIRDLAFRQVQYEWDTLDGRLKPEDKERVKALREQLAAYDRYKPTPPAPAITATDIGTKPPPTTIPGRRNSPELDPGFLTVLVGDAPATIPDVPDDLNTTGRRTALANWLTRPDNPLTTRVIANRIWQYHFGRGLVATSSDFGRLGEAPTHPELLDWLADYFVEHGWSFKAMHRLILNSATYRQASVVAASEAVKLVDPENRFLWKFPARRLDAEEIRDATLAVSGELALNPAGGPSVDHAQPRRTIYVKVIRNKREPLMDAFDAPDNFLSTATRNQTVTPSQSLLLINGEWALGRARAFANRVREAEPDGASARVALAYRLALSREPTTAEVAEAQAFLDQQRRALGVTPDGNPDDEALVDLCHALLNTNEFLHVD